MGTMVGSDDGMLNENLGGQGFEIKVNNAKLISMPTDHEKNR